MKLAEEQYNQRFTKEQIEKLQEYDLRNCFKPTGRYNEPFGSFYFSF